MTDKLKKQLILNLPYLIFVYLFDKLCQGVRLAPGADASEKLLHIGQGFSAAFARLAPSFHLLDLCVGAAGAVLIRLAVYSKGKNAKKYRRGIEYGSARWGTPADIAPYADPDFFQNVLLTQTERITMSSRPKEPKYARNKNILVIGGSGSGKTRFYVKPNLLQCHSSYVVTDPKGTILCEVGALLERRGYRIKSLNLINFKKSMKYNPLAYIRSEKDILKLVNALILNTKGEGEKSSEDFWVKAERLYYSALIGYIWYEAEPEERNFITLEKAVTGYEQSRKSAEKFIALIDKYENFDTLTNTMLNEFVEKILVHERARKGRQDTTQEVEIYFNFVGRYIPPALQPVPLTPEEQEELRKKEERKDRLHQNYLRRKANGKQKEWEERYMLQCPKVTGIPS